MALKSFFHPSKLRTDYLAAQSGQRKLFFFYDDVADDLMLMMANPDTETVVHYVDNHVGLLFDPTSLEIVGLQIEAFTHSFIPQYASLQKVWKLSDCKDIDMANVGELTFAIQEKQFDVAMEIVKVAEPILGNSAKPMARALEYA